MQTAANKEESVLEPQRSNALPIQLTTRPQTLSRLTNANMGACPPVWARILNILR
jgi:hypothetical protein